MKASDVVAKFIENHGISHVFELVGGMTTHLLDSIGKSNVKIVSMHHEQAAGFAAEGYGRISGKPGVALATSGPGATNLLTAIGSCYFDSVPGIFITGQVNTFEQKRELNIRQLGFQETDIVSVVSPICKQSFRIQTPEDLIPALEQAFFLSTEGRPGPVLIDIPMDIQRADIEYCVSSPQSRSSITHIQPTLEQVLKDLGQAQRPLILAGGGIQSSRCTSSFRQFVKQLGVPVVYSLMAVDVLPSSSPYRVGMLGSYGNRWANLAVGDADFILVLGSRLDVRQTGADTNSWKGERKIIHVDCCEDEINNRVTGCQKIAMDLAAFFAAMQPLLEDIAQPSFAGWLQQINTLKDRWPDTKELQIPDAGINPNVFMHQLAELSDDVGAYSVDVGQHQMWAAQSLDIGEHQRFLTSGGMGSMGFALPAAIGAQIAANQPVMVIAGDGGFQLNIQELQTIKRNKLPIKIIVINNHCHGMVRQFQESYFDSRFHGTSWGYDTPDFVKVAEAYGLPAQRIENGADVLAALTWLRSQETYALLEVIVNKDTNVYPKIAFGRAMTEMEPFAQPIEMEGT